MLNKLKSFIAERYDIDELVELAAFGRALRAEYEAHNIEVPEEIDSQLKAVRREINARQSDEIRARLKSAKSRLEALTPNAEKREQLRKEIADLEALANA